MGSDPVHMRSLEALADVQPRASRPDSLGSTHRKRALSLEEIPFRDDFAPTTFGVDSTSALVIRQRL